MPNRVRVLTPTVVKWRRQYAEDGLAGLADALRPGGPRTVLTDQAISEILAATALDAATGKVADACYPGTAARSSCGS